MCEVGRRSYDVEMLRGNHNRCVARDRLANKDDVPTYLDFSITGHNRLAWQYIRIVVDPRYI